MTNKDHVVTSGEYDKGESAKKKKYKYDLKQEKSKTNKLWNCLMNREEEIGKNRKERKKDNYKKWEKLIN